MNLIKDTAEEGAVPLEIANVVGVFYVLSSGVTVAMILAFLVVVLETLKVSKEIKVRLRRDLRTGLISHPIPNSMTQHIKCQLVPKLANDFFWKLFLNFEW